VLSVIGVIMIHAGVLAIFFGDKQIPVRDGIVLKLFDKGARPDDDDGDFSNWPYKYVFGGALIVVGVFLILMTANLV
jgi:hypothetical protein